MLAPISITPSFVSPEPAAVTLASNTLVNVVVVLPLAEAPLVAKAS
jgi:hypothetical protein